ncbi:hypothetical protein J437_LFUL010593 [Ladona fulva]|uniref:Uncharacterized protein n=1 Tax=Ladona fulva TaxID=123851 RepID=A0A8K0KAH8_LADFU|nr:hypothetical protein J437_LFUL010593 [Ladona fulva]
MRNFAIGTHRLSSPMRTELSNGRIACGPPYAECRRFPFKAQTFAFLKEGAFLTSGRSLRRSEHGALLGRGRLRGQGFGGRESRGRRGAADAAAAEDEAHEDVLQAPPAAHHEVLFRHQPQPGRQGSEATLAEDGTSEKSASVFEALTTILLKKTFVEVTSPVL